MNITQFQHIKKKIRKYMNDLSLSECKAEMLQNGLLNANLKLKKGEATSWGLELLPSVLSVLNTCPSAGECRYNCIAFTGEGNLLKTKKLFGDGELSAPLMKKARRMKIFLEDRQWFEAALKAEIKYKAEMAAIEGQSVYFRLNVVSDLEWFHITEAMPQINFYDYTKVWSRKSTTNYFLTFSASEKTDLFTIAEKLNSGENVAMAFVDGFSGRKGKDRKINFSSFMGFPVFNGDITDNRILDPRGGTIIALDAKVPVGGLDKKNKFFFSINDAETTLTIETAA